MTKQIVITGDSWAYASIIDTNGTTGPGFADLFINQGCEVKNLAWPNQSNKNSIEKLAEFLQQKKFHDPLVYFVQSDPFRSIRPYTEFTKLVIEKHGLFNARKYIMQQDYDQLEHIANLYSVNIHLIGGLSNVDENLLINTKWCSVLVDSWVKFLVGYRAENQNIDWSNWGLWGADWTFNHISINDLMMHGTMSTTFDSLAEQVIEELHIWDQNNRALHKDFFPDGSHPNFEGHRLLFEYIKKIIPLPEK